MKTLLQELQHFSGSEVFYRHPLNRNIVYTQGVQYLAEKASAYWLLDYIVSNQHEPKIKAEEFQVWQITVQLDNTAIIQVEDGNKTVVSRFELTFTDFPLQTFTLWMVDRTLMLPSEY